MKREERERLGKLLYELECKEFGGDVVPVPWDQYVDKGAYRRIAQAFAAAAVPELAMVACQRHGKLHLFESGDDAAAFLKAADNDWNYLDWCCEIVVHHRKDGE